ncbi:MAG: outer membrane protein [Hyphomicrobiaceae bacterium]
MRAVRAVALSFALASALPLLVPLAVPGAAAADLGGRSKIAHSVPEALPSPLTWAGLYVGAHVGYGWSSIEWQEGAFTGSHDGEGLLAGGQIGFNLQMGRLVYGLEADATAGFIEGGNGCCSHSVDALYSVRARAGLASADNRWLFYVTGGAAFADIDYGSAGFGGHSDMHFGWVAGAGIERALARNLTARLEYLYYDFDSLSAPAGALGGGATDLDPTIQTVRFGLNFKF